MPAPLPLVPAIASATAASAYLSARLQLPNDLAIIRSVTLATIQLRLSRWRDQINLFYLLESRAQQYPDREFLVFTGASTPRPSSSPAPASPTNPDAESAETQTQAFDTYTYAAALRHVLSYARFLRARCGVCTGDVVALASPNAPHFVWAWLALWSLGATPAFVNPHLRGPALAHSVRVAGARVVLADPELTAAFAAAGMGSEEEGRKGVEVVVLTPALRAEIEAMEGYRAPDADRSGQTEADMALLIFTSGTTGLPKPAVVSWWKASAGSGFVARWMGVRAEDRVFTAMPLYHSSASLLGLLTVLQTPCTLILAPSFSPRHTLPLLHATRATLLQYVGETLRYLLATPTSSLDRTHRVRLAYGNGLRPDVWRAARDRFALPAVAEFYSATESPSALWNLARNPFALGAVGRAGALLSRAIRRKTALVALDPVTLADPRRDSRTGRCVRVGPGEPGELLYKLDPGNVRDAFQGYYANDDATAKKVLRDVFAAGDAYYRTGDVLRADAEGRWWFVDRVGDTFRWKSENVSTAEVADVVATTRFASPATSTSSFDDDDDKAEVPAADPDPDDIPAAQRVVAETAVYGVALPGHDGRAGCAAVALAPAARGDVPRALRAIARHCDARLPGYAVPVFVRVVAGELERTGTNKFQKARLQREGVEPGMVGGEGGAEKVYWRRGDGEWREFGKREWGELEGGRVRL